MKIFKTPELLSDPATDPKLLSLQRRRDTLDAEIACGEREIQDVQAQRVALAADAHRRAADAYASERKDAVLVELRATLASLKDRQERLSAAQDERRSVRESLSERIEAERARAVERARYRHDYFIELRKFNAVQDQLIAANRSARAAFQAAYDAGCSELQPLFWYELDRPDSRVTLFRKEAKYFGYPLS